MPSTLEAMETIHEELAALTVRWAMRRQLDERRAGDLRRHAIELCHRHYHSRIPFYRLACARMDVGVEADLETILERMLIPDEIFKSYSPAWIDEGRWDRMNAWVSQLSTAEIDFDTRGIANLDQWLEEVEQRGLKLVFSSGTSGHISFVPRDAACWSAFTELALLYLPGSFGDRGLMAPWTFALMRALATRLQPKTFAALVKGVGLRRYDGVFLNFSGGNQGVQLAGQELGRLTRSAHYLYEREMSPTAVRAIVRGPRDVVERELVEDFLGTTVRDQRANLDRLISALRDAANDRRRVLLFGTPALFLELCHAVERSGFEISLAAGSGLAYGGGWKSFTGERVDEAELVARMRRDFGVPRAAISESYSMTEINGIFQRCPHGAFHVPPFLETMVVDEEHHRLDGDDVSGTLAVLDPYATSYPGFLLTGDNVRLSRRVCECGIPGTTLTSVGRAPGREIKGCGGIMAAVHA